MRHGDAALGLLAEPAQPAAPLWHGRRGRELPAAGLAPLQADKKAPGQSRAPFPCSPRGRDLFEPVYWVWFWLEREMPLRAWRSPWAGLFTGLPIGRFPALTNAVTS